MYINRNNLNPNPQCVRFFIEQSWQCLKLEIEWASAIEKSNHVEIQIYASDAE